LGTDRDERVRKAETFARQGRLEDAIAEYERLRGATSGDLASENALGDLLVRVGRTEQAATCFMRVGDHHLREGFFAKAAGFYKKVLKIDREHEPALINLAEASLQMGLIVDARQALGQVAVRRRRRGDLRGADEIRLRVAELDPRDITARLEAARALAGAGQPGATARFRAIAADLEAQGRPTDALEVWGEALVFDPGDREVRVRLVRAALDASDLEVATAWLQSADLAGSTELLALAAEVEIRRGDIARLAPTVERWLQGGPDAALAVGERARALMTSNEAGPSWVLVEALARRQAAEPDSGVVGLLSEFAERWPDHLPAWLLLVDLAVGGGQGDDLIRAQAGLAAAYVACGQLEQAKAVAEDLAARDPDDPAHRERLVEILAQLGERLPDVSTGLDGVDPDADGFNAPSDTGGPWPGDDEATLDADALDLAWLLGDVEEGRPGRVLTEVDLTPLLDALTEVSPAEAHGEHALATPAEMNGDESGHVGTEADATIEGVFTRLRQEAASARHDAGGPQLALGRTYRAAGMLTEATTAFERASRDPECRFDACLALAEVDEARGEVGSAVAWYERALEGADGAVEARVKALYRLADVLDRAGERARALAVWLEIQALSPGYRDVAHRVAQATEGGGAFTP
jgi:tetratricopeptide (TPR) repeat protein